MLRKTLVLGLVAIAATVLAAPALVGWHLAEYHATQVRLLAVPGLVEIRSSQFSRGWFRSSSRVRLAPVPDLCPHMPCPVVTVDSVVHHGPIPFTAPPGVNGGLELAQAVVISRIDFAELFADVRFQPALPEIEAESRIRISGAVDSRLSLPGARLEVSGLKNPGRVVSERLVGRIDIDAERARIEGDLEWPAFSLERQAGGGIAWRGLSAEFSGDTQAPRLWQRGRLGLESVAIRGNRGKGPILQGLVVNAQALPADQGGLASRFDLRLSRVGLTGGEYGPAIVEGRFDGIDWAAISRLRDELQAMRRRDLPAAEAYAAMAGAYRAHMPKILATAPSIRIRRFLMGTQQGDLTGSLLLAMPADQATPETAVELLHRLKGEFQLRIPAPLLRSALASSLLQDRPGRATAGEQEVSAAIQRLQDQGLLAAQTEEQVYLISARLADGRLSINGQPSQPWAEWLRSLRDTGA